MRRWISNETTRSAVSTDSRLIAGATFLVVAFTLFAASIVSAAEPGFPGKVGTRWVYGAGKAEVIEEIVAIEEINDESCLKIETRIGETPLSFEHIAVRADGLYRVTIGGEPVVPPLCFFRFAPRSGEKWKVKSTVGDVEVTGQYTAGTSLITVPAGRFTVISSRGQGFPPPNEKLDITCFYANGVGKVKQVIANGPQQTELVLKEFRPASTP